MRLVSWNVNGLRANITKGFFDFFKDVDADIFAIQETKMQEEQKNFSVEGYFQYWNSAIKKGYSGTLVFSKIKPLNVIYGINDLYNDEGRVITLEFARFYFVTIYTPNSQENLTRLDYRMRFEDELQAYLSKLDAIKPVILCGDLNVAHFPIDIKNPKSNEQNPGYTIEERNKFTNLLDSGFIDTFRTLYPDTVKYSWWSYRFNARNNNAGWRIDYFVTSKRLISNLNDSIILDKIMGSDHCPVLLDIEI